MKFPLFHLLMDTEVHNQSVFIKDVSLDMSSTSTGKTFIHLILTTQKITTEYDKVNISLSFIYGINYTLKLKWENKYVLS